MRPISKTKKIIFTIIWIAIISYLFWDFMQTNPFGKNSAFTKASCKKTSKEIKVEYKGF